MRPFAKAGLEDLIQFADLVACSVDFQDILQLLVLVVVGGEPREDKGCLAVSEQGIAVGGNGLFREPWRCVDNDGEFLFECAPFAVFDDELVGDELLANKGRCHEVGGNGVGLATVEQFVFAVPVVFDLVFLVGGDDLGDELGFFAGIELERFWRGFPELFHEDIDLYDFMGVADGFGNV